MKCLICSQDKVLISELKNLLHGARIACSTATDFESSISSAKHHSWNFIFVDQQLQTANPLDLISHLRYELLSCSIVAISTHPDNQNSFACRRAGATRVIQQQDLSASLINKMVSLYKKQLARKNKTPNELCDH